MPCPEAVAKICSPYTGQAAQAAQAGVLSILALRLGLVYSAGRDGSLGACDPSISCLGPLSLCILGGPSCLCFCFAFVMSLGNAFGQHTKPAFCCDMNEDLTVHCVKIASIA